MSIVKRLKKITGNELSGVVSDGMVGDEAKTFVDTGTYMLNALISGDIFGGLPSNKITAIAGPESTGKTFIALSMVKQFLDQHPENEVVYIESENAISKELIEERGIDSTRLGYIELSTVQEFRKTVLDIISEYSKENTDKSKPPRLLIVLDSLGMLSTTKEIEDTAAGSETKDMSRSGILKATFRVLTLKLGLENIPLLVTNHTYDTIGSMYGGQTMSGGCLTGGTCVKTDDGVKPIEEIKVGDKVLTLFGFEEVLEKHQFDNLSLLKIEFSDGYKVSCSEDHKFLTIANGEDFNWVTAHDLKRCFDETGDTPRVVVKSSNLGYLNIDSIERINTETVYDISVNKYQSYILDNGIVSHNSGLKYSASTIIHLSKRKEKDGSDQVGVIISATAKKSRFTQENKKVELLLDFRKGLNKYFGLLEYGEKAGIFKKVSTRYETPNGQKLFKKQIMKEPEKFFTEEYLEKINEFVKDDFKYGGNIFLEMENQTQEEGEIDE